jgi:O-antigen/teichoic acid export membrane protein
MLQRKQTLWLLLAAVCTALSFKLPFFSVAEKTNSIFKNITASEAPYTVACGIITAVLCLVTIFLYNRVKQQLVAGVLTLVAALLHIVLLYVSVLAAGVGSPSLTILLPIAAVLFVFLAIIGIRKDKKTLEEMNSNRLR